MEIIKAEAEHKKIVLKLLDGFRTECSKLINPEKNFISTSAQDSGGPVFDNAVKSSNHAIFLARKDNNFVGIATVSKIPQIRKGTYYAEIEEMFVIPEFQGRGAAGKLIEAIITWAEENNINSIRLESSNELKRAHSFYEKYGFRFYGRAYEKIIS